MGILCNKWQLDGSHKPCCRNTSCPACTTLYPRSKFEFEQDLPSLYLPAR